MGVEGNFRRFERDHATRVADRMLARTIADVTARRVTAYAEANRALVGVVVPAQVQILGNLVTVNSASVTGTALVPVSRTATAVATIAKARSGIVTATWLFTAVQLIILLRNRSRRTKEEDVLQYIARLLYERSPYRAGAYRESHMLLADGVSVASARAVANGADVPHAKVYTFTSGAPYSRKIEVGKTESGRDFVVSVPNRIYQRTAADAAGRFPQARISFSFESQNEGAVGGWARSASARRLAGRVRRGNAANHDNWLRRQPTITVRTT